MCLCVQDRERERESITANYDMNTIPFSVSEPTSLEITVPKIYVKKKTKSLELSTYL